MNNLQNPKPNEFIYQISSWEGKGYERAIEVHHKGITKRMYLQGKIQELMALQLAPILAEQDGLQPFPRLKAQTIVCIHHAKEILLSRLDNPPSLMELAQMVGVSSRTLRYGFKEVFGTTVFGYLTEQRMEQAEQLLRSGKLSIAEVANLIGYSQPGNFAAVFKIKFGITPSECLSGKNNIFGA
ncbi:helix-turn-helix transcriptional regulator [Nostoc sp.]|uniref:helix-turn-helix transcriptional regulator n=1 Tax=Nostoc sp. TaxID=1180 RepID=UPI002FFA4468